MGWYTDELWVDPLSDDGEGAPESWPDWIVNLAILGEALWTWQDHVLPEIMFYVFIVIAAVGFIVGVDWMIHA